MARSIEQESGGEAQLSRLMVLAQGGDATAYRQLLEAVTPVLRRYFRRRVGDDALMEDLVQDTLLSVHRARHTYLPEHPFMPWAMTIARNSMMDAFRKRQRRGRYETSVDVLPDVPAPDAWQGDGGVQAGAILEQLPAGQREAVRLTKLEGMSVAEASRELGISESALKVRVHRALGFLKNVFLEDE